MVDLNLYNNAASLIDAGSADYRQRLVALQAQQNAASAAAQAAAQQGGTNRAKQYADSVAGGMNDLRNTGGAGMFGGALQTQQSLNAAGIADQGARTAQHLAEAGSVINTSFNDRLAGAATIQAQSKDTLAHDFYNLAAQQAAATSSGGSGGGGGGGGRGGGGGGSGGSSSDYLTAGNATLAADEATRINFADRYQNELLGGASPNLRKFVVNEFGGDPKAVFGKHALADHHPHSNALDHVGNARARSIAQWNYNAAHHIRNGVSLTNVRKFWNRATKAAGQSQANKIKIWNDAVNAQGRGLG